MELSKSRQGEKRRRGRAGERGALFMWNIKSDVGLSSDWQEIIDKCVYWLFSVIAGEKQ